MYGYSYIYRSETVGHNEAPGMGLAGRLGREVRHQLFELGLEINFLRFAVPLMACPHVSVPRPTMLTLINNI